MAAAPRTYAAAGVSLATADAVVERLRFAVESTRTPAVEGGFGRSPASSRSTSAGCSPPRRTPSARSSCSAASGETAWRGADLAAHGINDVLTMGAAPLSSSTTPRGPIDPEQIVDLVEGAAESAVPPVARSSAARPPSCPGLPRRELDFVARRRLVDATTDRRPPDRGRRRRPRSSLRRHARATASRSCARSSATTFDPISCSPRRVSISTTSARFGRRPMSEASRTSPAAGSRATCRVLPDGLGAVIDPALGAAAGLRLARRATVSPRTSCVGSSTSVSGIARSSRSRRRDARPRDRPTSSRGRWGRMERRVIGVLVSGGGTNLQALIDAAPPIVAVAANMPRGAALARAEAAGVPTGVFVLVDTRVARAGRSAGRLAPRHGVELAVLPGTCSCSGRASSRFRG